MNINFENGKDRVKKGIQLASNSFFLLWKHKILSLYLAFPIGMYLLMQLISWNIGAYDISFTTGLPTVGHPFDLSSWHHYLWLLLIMFIYIFLYTFITVSLIYHTNQLLEYQTTTITHSINHAFKKRQLILTWAIIVTVLAYALQILSGRVAQTKQFFNPVMLIVSILGLAWSLFTLLVLPIITLERITIIEALKKSILIIRVLLIEILSGEFWIILIGILAMIPFIIPLILLETNIKIPNFVVLGATSFILVIGWLISTVYGIFKTIVYNYYMKPIEELEALRYLRF